MSKGFQMMLEALGIKIDPAEVEQLYTKLKHDIPAMAKFVGEKFESIDQRLMRIEAHLGIVAAGDREKGEANGKLLDTIPIPHSGRQ